MKAVIIFLVVALSLAAALPNSEHLRYQINWPSGISLGEGQLKTVEADGQWKLELVLEGSIPGFQMIDRFHATLNSKFCTTQFERDSLHGTRKSKEKTTFDLAAAKANRQTEGGGSSEISIGPCPRDALGFLFFARQELIAGRLPAALAIYAGATYQLRMELLGARTVAIGGAPMQADCYRISVKGDASDATFEVLFAKDEARTPVLVRVPFVLGTFTMELIP